MTELKILSWTKNYLLLDKKQNGCKKVMSKKDKRKTSIVTKHVFKNVLSVFNSFTITQCQVSIDTGNMPLNGLLYPLFWFASRYVKHPVQINFKNENYICLQIKNNLARITWAYITA